MKRKIYMPPAVGVHFLYASEPLLQHSFDGNNMTPQPIDLFDDDITESEDIG